MGDEQQTCFDVDNFWEMRERQQRHQLELLGIRVLVATGLVVNDEPLLPVHHQQVHDTAHPSV
jgi:hypothetical protein